MCFDYGQLNKTAEKFQIKKDLKKIKKLLTKTKQPDILSKLSLERATVKNKEH